LYCIDAVVLIGNNIRMFLLFLCTKQLQVRRLTRWDVVGDVAWLDRYQLKWHAWIDSTHAAIVVSRTIKGTHRTVRAVSLYSQWREKEW